MFKGENDEIESLIESEYKHTDHKKVLNEQAFENPEMLNNRVLYARISNWKLFSSFFLCFTIAQIVIEGYYDLDTYLFLDSYMERTISFYSGIEFLNARYFFNFIVFRFLKRGFSVAVGLLLTFTVCSKVKESQTV